MGKRKKLFWFIFTVFVGFIFYSGSTVLADEVSDKFNDLQNQISELEKKLEETWGQKQTLSSQIAYMNQQIQIAQLKINQTQAQISALEEEINDLSLKIDRLDVSLDKLSQLLLRRVVETYKKGQLEPALLLFATEDMSQFLNNYRYLQEAQKHDKTLILAVQAARDNFDAQKSLKEEKQAELEKLRTQLQQQNNALAQQRKEKDQLLVITKNDEARYQQLLAQAQKELASLLSFTRTRVGESGSICAGEFSSGQTGWFFSQRDSRWCSSLIGNSDMTIGQVGCLISSVAMVNKSKGANITPLGIANNSSFFLTGTAYMLQPFPSFIDSSFKAISKEAINEELEKNNPVIVHLALGGDGHWIVLAKKEGDNYIINDPWYGPDKKLTDYYSWGLIGRAYALK